MASPLSVFRKHQYWFLVGLGVLLMVAFVVLPPVDDYLRHRTVSGGASARAVVVRWKGGTVTEGELQSMRNAYRLTRNFLEEVIRLAIQRKGVPKGPDPRSFGSDSDQGLIATMILAAKAEQLGMVINDDAVQDYLDRLSDRLLSAEDFQEIFKRVSGGRLPVSMMFQWLRRELMAYYLRQHVVMGVAAATPAEHWQNFLRVYQRTAIELLPLAVADFLDQLPRGPTEQELRQLYEQYKERYPDPMSPQPGFRRLPKTNFAYVRIDGNQLLEQEKQRISEEEILKEYEEGLKRGDYRKRPEEKAPEATTPETPKGESAQEGQGEKSGDASPAEAKKDGSQPEENSPRPQNEAGQSDNAPPGESKDTSPMPPPPTADQPTESSGAQAAAQADSSSSPQPTTADQQSQPSATESPNPTEPASKTPAPAAGADAQAAPAASPAASNQGEPRPLEEVRDQILTRLAQPRAQKRRDEIVDAVRRQMERYFQAYSIWELRPKGDNSPQPPPPDPREWVEKFGVTVGETGLVDFYTVEKTELGKTSLFDRTSFTFRPFREVGFDPDVPLFRPREIQDADDFRIDYVYWKVAQQAEYVPSFEEVRGEVEQAWRMEEARKLARQKAQQLQQEAASKEGTLRERLPQYADKIVEPPEFSWITWGMTLGLRGFEPPHLSDVEGVEGETWEFMRAVFSTPVDAVGMASNAPQDHFYVFRTVRRVPPESELRSNFLEALSQSPREYEALGSASLQTYYQNWYRELEREMEVEWQRAPGGLRDEG